MVNPEVKKNFVIRSQFIKHLRNYLDDMGYIFGGFDGLLPYGKEIDRCATEGGMFLAIKYCNPKYTASLNKVLDALEQMELAEQAAEDADDEDEFEEDDADE